MTLYNVSESDSSDYFCGINLQNNRSKNDVSPVFVNYSLFLPSYNDKIQNQTLIRRQEGIVYQEKIKEGYQTSQTELIVIVCIIAFIMITIIIMFAIRLNQKAEYHVTQIPEKDVDWQDVDEQDLEDYKDDSSYIGPYRDRESSV